MQRDTSSEPTPVPPLNAVVRATQPIECALKLGPLFRLVGWGPPSATKHATYVRILEVRD